MSWVPEILKRTGGILLKKPAGWLKSATKFGAKEVYKHPIKAPLKTGIAATGVYGVCKAAPVAKKGIDRATNAADEFLDKDNESRSSDIAGFLGAGAGFLAGYHILNSLILTQAEKSGNTTWFTTIKKVFSALVGGVFGFLSFGWAQKTWANMQAKTSETQSSTSEELDANIMSRKQMAQSTNSDNAEATLAANTGISSTQKGNHNRVNC